MPPTELIEQSSAPTERKIGNQPAGLYTLFFTEMWERFSYYGMRALLVLFMVDSVRGGMGLSDELATSIYGLYTAAVYLASLPGGWLSDRLLGPQRTIWYGGLIIALGHFTLALPQTQTFYLGLVFVVIGSGMLKPNMSALVGELYPEGGARRDAGFTIFYMGINWELRSGHWYAAPWAKNRIGTSALPLPASECWRGWLNSISLEGF